MDKTHKEILYRQAFQTWAALFEYETAFLDTNPTCQDAWRVRRIVERAHRRLLRRAAR